MQRATNLLSKPYGSPLRGIGIYEAAIKRDHTPKVLALFTI